MNQFQFRKVQAEGLVAQGLVKDELTPKKTTKIQDQVNLEMYTEGIPCNAAQRSAARRNATRRNATRRNATHIMLKYLHHDVKRYKTLKYAIMRYKFHFKF
jgi:hypothetical protein